MKYTCVFDHPGGNFYSLNNESLVLKLIQFWGIEDKNDIFMNHKHLWRRVGPFRKNWDYKVQLDSSNTFGNVKVQFLNYRLNITGVKVEIW